MTAGIIMNISSPRFERRRRIAVFLSLLGISAFFLGLLIIPSPVDARVQGRCKDCHSMHSSKEGSAETYGGLSGPFPVLTEGGCLGCHGQNPSGGQNIVPVGLARAPQVIHNQKNGDLAAGNFYYVADAFTGDHSKGHNVMGISRQENPPMDTPPGFVGSVLIPGGTGPTRWPENKQLSCAGTWGCHGNRTIEDPYKAMAGAHHADDSVIDGMTVGTSYRYLLGVKGREHQNWEYLATIDDHNGYKGDPTHSSMDTISYLCGQCHVKFHASRELGGGGSVGTVYTGLWTRHPSDISFSTVHGGYAGSEYERYITYSLEAPVAYVNPTGNEKSVGAESILMCLSCHRAHGSPHADILRWDYASMVVGAGVPKTGCLTCHTKKGDHF